MKTFHERGENALFQNYSVGGYCPKRSNVRNG